MGNASPSTIFFKSVALHKDELKRSHLLMCTQRISYFKKIDLTLANPEHTRNLYCTLLENNFLWVQTTKYFQPVMTVYTSLIGSTRNLVFPHFGSLGSLPISLHLLIESDERMDL